MFLYLIEPIKRDDNIITLREAILSMNNKSKIETAIQIVHQLIDFHDLSKVPLLNLNTDTIQINITN